jgi:integrase
VREVEGKPRRKRRETVYTADQWQKIRAEVKDQAFGDLLDFLWATGCRPIEARILSSEHVDLKNAIAILPPSDAKGERHERVIFLPDEAVAICKRRIESQGDGRVFVNLRGTPWTKDAIACRFKRIREKLKIPMCAYAVRPTFATDGLSRGFDSLTLAQIMGHADTSMLARHYAHLSRNPAYLREVARKLRDPNS